MKKIGNNTQHRAVECHISRPETVDPASLELTLILNIGFDILNFQLKWLVSLYFLERNTVRAREGVLCFFNSVTGSKPSGIMVIVVRKLFSSDDACDIYLGDSGMKRMPIPRMKGQMRPIPTTVRQEPAPDMLRVAMEMQSAERQKRELCYKHAEFLSGERTYKRRGYQT